MTRECPRVATWLLRQFGCSPKNDSLIGDLMEQYQEGHTPFWYWSQVLATIVTSFAGEIRDHKLLAVRAIATGWVSLVACFFLLLPLNSVLEEFDPNSVWSYYLFSGLLSPLWLDYYKWLHPAVKALGMISTCCVIGVASGGVVARFHRSNSRPFVLAYAMSVSAIALYILFSLLPSFSRFGGEFTVAIQVALLVSAVLCIVSILAGGGMLFRFPKRL